jgi:hypothetical protein
MRLSDQSASGTVGKTLGAIGLALEAVRLDGRLLGHGPVDRDPPAP